MTKVKKDFKQTDVGLIPEDWDLIKIGDVLEFKNGLNKAKEYFGKGTPIINYMDVFRHPGLTEELINGKVTLSKDEIRRFNVQKGDVFFTRTSETVDEIGISSVLEENIKDGVFSGFVLRGRPLNNRLGLKFKRYCFSSYIVRQQIISSATYTTRALTNGRHLSKVQLPVPGTEEEQQAIASALSDVDELIRSLDGLIQKKQAIKKGTMQQLLTGKKRLPGFDGEWEVKTIGDLAQIGRGRVISRREIAKSSEHKYPVYSSQTSNDGIIGKIDTYDFEGKYVTWTTDGANAGTAFYRDGKFNCTNVCGTLKFNRVEPSFMVHVINLEAKAYVSTNLANPKLMNNMMAKVDVKIPQDVVEQKAIAGILSDMDRELQTLRQKREKYVQIKQGMMQELLTGKVRLVKPISEPIQTAQPKRQRSWAFEEAVIISTLIDRFSKEGFPLSRFRYVKYSYLLKRFKEMEVKDYLKKAAGPYNPQTRYGGPERISKDKKYIVPATSGKYKGFVPGDNIEEATGYFVDWFGTEVLEWLEQFRYTKNDELELLTTVDLAIQDLKETNSLINTETVKRLINAHAEWRPKLKRKAFSDDHLEEAIRKVNLLFNLR